MCGSCRDSRRGAQSGQPVCKQGPQGPQGPQSHVHRAQGGVAEHTGQASVATPSSGQPFEKGVQSKDSGDEEKKGKKEGLRWR